MNDLTLDLDFWRNQWISVWKADREVEQLLSIWSEDEARLRDVVVIELEVDIRIWILLGLCDVLKEPTTQGV
jgi:hypothetical protein